MTAVHLPLYWNPNDHEHSRPYVPLLAVNCALRSMEAYVEADGRQLEDIWDSTRTSSVTRSVWVSRRTSRPKSSALSWTTSGPSWPRRRPIPAPST